MPKQLILHIGTPKTGSTAIQNFLVNNLDKLKQEGIEYPMTSIPVGCFSWTDGNIGKIVQNSKLSAKEKAKEIISLCGNYQKVLLSTERIWVEIVDKTSFFSEFVDNGYTVKVIVYLREQAEYLESVYRESVKAEPHLILTSEQLLDDNCDLELPWRKDIENGMHYYDRLNEIASVIGKDNIVVRIYDKNNFKNGSIYEDFLDAIGIQIDNLTNWVIPEKRINPSLNQVELELMRKLNGLKEFYSCQELSGAFFEPISKQASLTEKSIHFNACFSNEERYRLFRKYREENQLLAKEYLNRETDLFEWKPSEKGSEGIEEGKMLETLTYVYGMTVLDINRKLKLLEKRITEGSAANIDKSKSTQKQLDELQLQCRERYEYFEKRMFEEQEKVTAIKNGYSWRITAPLRKVKRIIEKTKRKFGGRLPEN